MADDVVIRISAKDLAQQGFRKAEKRVERLGKRLDGFSTKAKSMGAGMTKWVTGPIALFGAGVFKVGVDYDNALKSMSTSTGAVGADLDALGQTFKGVFGAVPDDAATVATAIGDINTITGATGPALQAMTQQVLDASRVLGEEATPNAKGFANALVQFERPAEEGAAILDRLFTVSQNTGAGLGALISQTNTYGSVLKNAGFSMEESAQLFGALSKTGIEVSRLMPGLNAAFRNWSKEGLNSRDMLQRTIEAMRAAKTDTEALSIATDAFGAEGAQRMTTAVRNGSFALEDLGDSLVGAEGKIQDTVDANRPLREEFQLLWREVQTQLIPAGKSLVDTLREMKPTFRAISERVAGVVQWFSELSPQMQSTIGVAALLFAGLGPLIGGLGFLAAGISAALPLFGALKIAALALTGPFGLVVAAVSAAVLIWQNWDTVKAMFGAAKDFIVKTARGLYTGVKDWLVGRFQSIVDGVKAKIDMVTGFFKGMFDAVVGNSFVPDMAAAVKAEFASMGQAMVDDTGKATSVVKARMSELQGIADNLFGATTISRAQDMVTALDGVENVSRLTTTAKRQLHSALTAALDAYRALGQEAPPTMVAVEQSTAAHLRTVDMLVLGYSALPPVVNSAGVSFLKLSDASDGAQQRLFNFATQAVPGVVHSTAATVGETQSLWSGFGGFMQGQLGSLNNIFQAAFTGGGGALGAVQSFATQGIAALMNMIPMVGPIISQFSGAFVAGFKKIGSAIAGAFGFGGPSAAEQEGRRVAGTFRQGLLAELNPEQMAEVQEAIKGAWKGNEIGAATVIAIRDAYIAAGASAEDALDVVNRLWQAEQEGGAAVQEVIDEITTTIEKETVPGLDALAETGRGTFEELTGTIDIMQATIANTDSLDRMAAEFRKASDGSTYDLGTILREAESLTDSLGSTHPAVVQMQGLIRDASETGVWDFQQMALAIGAIKDEMATPIVIPVTPVLTGMIDPDREGNDRLSPSNFRTREAWEANWLARNPGDAHRADEALGGHQFAAGTGGLRQFSPFGTPAWLHGEEEVLTRQQGEGVASMTARAIQAAEMRAVTTSSDGRLLAEAVNGIAAKVAQGVAKVLSGHRVPVTITLNGTRLAEELVPILPGELSRAGFRV